MRTTITTRPITPENFWEVFSDKLRTDWNNPAMRVSEYYDHACPWTIYITETLHNIAERFSCISKREFWPRIDICYFDKYESDWDEWSLEAAIELENNTNWTQEICKLLMVNAGLKVLIAYEDNRQTVDSQLRRFKEIYESRKYHTHPASWLFIFGPRLIGAPCDFVAYKFDGSEVTDITGGAVTIRKQEGCGLELNPVGGSEE